MMQTITLSYAASVPLLHPVHVGVVASGDLEIVVIPVVGSATSTVVVRTSADGFDTIWKRVLDRFFKVSAREAHYEINDFGATPGMVSLRLAQALERAEEGDAK